MTVTPSSARHIGRLYESFVGYDAVQDGEPPLEVLRLLRVMMTAQVINPDDPGTVCDMLAMYPHSRATLRAMRRN